MAFEENLDAPSFNDGDVLSFRDGTVKFARLKHVLSVAFHSKVPDALVDSLITQKFHSNADKQFRASGAWSYRDNDWFREGVDCEILQIGCDRWQKGKVRLRVSIEFVPEEEPLEEYSPATTNGYRNGRAKILLDGAHPGLSG